MESHYIEKTSKKQDPSCSDGSKNIVIGEVLHDVLHTAPENVAQPVDGLDFYVLIVTQPIQERAIDVMVGIQIILGYAALLHGFP